MTFNEYKDEYKKGNLTAYCRINFYTNKEYAVALFCTIFSSISLNTRVFVTDVNQLKNQFMKDMTKWIKNVR